MDAQMAIEKCNKDEFERAMHRLQDYYFHYAKGFRWKPSEGKFGHPFKPKADNDPVAWARANQITEKCVKEWEARCRCE